MSDVVERAPMRIGMTMSDVAGGVVDVEHRDRACPYCGRPQRWVSDPEGRFESHYFHLDDLNQHCDAERLTYWEGQ